MNIVDDMFEGEVELSVPTALSEYQRKMPGATDAQGDYCAS